MSQHEGRKKKKRGNKYLNDLLYFSQNVMDNIKMSLLMSETFALRKDH